MRISALYARKMALSKIDMKRVQNKNGLQILNESPAYFAGVLMKLRVCYDLCLYGEVKMLKGEVQNKIEQCAVDFRHISMQTSTLAERVGSGWCRDCILFFGNLQKIGDKDPSKILNRISSQAKDLSSGFARIGEWVRDLAGRFHECQELSERDKRILEEQVKNALEDCEDAQREAAALQQQRGKELQKARDGAQLWGIATNFPVVNIVAIPIHKWKEGEVDEARRNQETADKAASDARRALAKATSDKEKTEEAAKHVGDLIKQLGQVEAICEAQAAFWSYQADKFGTFSGNVKSAQDFIELGMGEEAVKELTDWLKERKGQLEKYHLVMQEVNNSFNFPTSAKPMPLNGITLDALDLTIE